MLLNNKENILVVKQVSYKLSQRSAIYNRT